MTHYSKIVLLLACLCVPGPVTANDEAEQVAIFAAELVGSNATQDGWSVELRYVNLGAAPLESVALTTSAPESAVLELASASYEGHAIVPISRLGLSPGDYVVVDVKGHYGPHEQDVVSTSLFFHVDDQWQLKEANVGDFEAAQGFSSEKGLIVVAHPARIPPPPGTEHLEPWDDPNVSPENQRKAREIAALTEDEAQSATGGALTATVRSPAEGCAGGSAAGWWCLIGGALGLAGRLRSRFWGAVVALGLLVSATGRADARTVSGYIAFYENRTFHSLQTGSRFKTPTVFSSCLPNNANCVYRPMGRVTIEVRNNGTAIYTTQTGTDGYFYLPIAGTSPGENPSLPYDLHVTFDNPSFPGLPETRLRLSAFAAPSTVASSVVLKTAINASNPGANNQGIILLSSSPASTPVGQWAAAWSTTRLALDAIELEGETRQYRNFGASPSSYNLMLLRWLGATAKDVEAHCSLSTVSFGGYVSSNATILLGIGSLYRGRVVGCSSPVAGATTNYPAFPIDKRSELDQRLGPSTAEGMALGASLDYLVQLLARWDPATTVVSASDFGTACLSQLVGGTTCTFDAYPNSNDSTNVINVVRALWDLIDADTGSTKPGSSDLSDLTLVTVMDGLEDLSASPEATFVAHSPPFACNKNEDCANGEACVMSQNNCYSGDVHGDNVLDLLVEIVAATANINHLYTLLSTPCLGPADDTYAYCGGFRGD